LNGVFGDEVSIGRVAREAIYYGADSFYLHQLSKFSRIRYRDDATWLLQNAGLSIRSMIDIAKFIGDRINRQMNGLTQARAQGMDIKSADLTSSLVIPKADLEKKFGQKAKAFIAKFATPAIQSNTEFSEPFALNAVSIAPLIDLGEFLYVPNQYRLFETIYGSPFYWMLDDQAYRNKASDHRGAFVEGTAAHIFRSVFGVEHVYENVAINVTSKDIAGEIDVLVLFGEFVLVVQAESKRLTMKSRSGDADALKVDFQGAIQGPYNQALTCAELIRGGATCTTKDGKKLTFPLIARSFPIVILSDPFPASTILSRSLLERGDDTAPVIWDIGLLDCVSRLLPTPVEMLFYLKSRAELFDNVMSDSEYNYLGFHIKAKLVLPDGSDMLFLDRDFATVVDDFMISADMGIAANRPLSALESINIPIIAELLKTLKSAMPAAALVIDLYDFSSAALEDFANHVVNLRKEVASSKAIKAFSILTRSGGITYAVTRKGMIYQNSPLNELVRRINTTHDVTVGM
jgi:hypothetical protein